MIEDTLIVNSINWTQTSLNAFAQAGLIHQCTIEQVGKNMEKDSYSNNTRFTKAEQKGIQSNRDVWMQGMKANTASIRIKNGICK